MRMVWGAGLGAAAVIGVAACGSVTLPVAPTTSPFDTAHLSVRTTGNAPVTVDTASVSFHLDDAGTLVGTVSITSHAALTTTVMVRVSLYSPSGSLVGDATGGKVQVPPDTPTDIRLSGPAPVGTIASATVEVSLPPPPTQTPGGGPTPETQLAVPTPA
ncbi:MAG: hypothetical protein ACYDAC_02790 [Candidatus Dormibacteria bacterium]